MRPSIAVFVGLFLSATLIGCGGEASIPAPPAEVKLGPPPGSSPEMAVVKKGNMGGMGAAKPAAKGVGKTAK